MEEKIMRKKNNSCRTRRRNDVKSIMYIEKINYFSEKKTFANDQKY